MLNTAWAIEIKPENYSAILSEGGRTINKEFLARWVAKYPDGGFFVRDEERMRFDCTLMTADAFYTLYSYVEMPFCEGETEKGEACNGAHFRAITSQEKVDRRAA